MDHRAQIGNEWVDLGEIEYHVSRCPYIKDSAVLLQDTPQGQEIIAYITSAEKGSSNFLLCYLRNVLLEHMVPARVIQMESFPFTPNGKIDRNALTPCLA